MMIKIGGLTMAKKKKKEPRVASVDANGILVRDLRATGIWLVVITIVGIAAGMAVGRFL